MTLKEAIAESSRRMGWTEERINEAMKWATSMMPVPEEILNREMREEDVEGFIRTMMNLHTVADSNLEELRRETENRLRKRAENN